MSEQVATRNAYRDTLVELMADDRQLLCLDTDTGLFAGVEFGDPRRYLSLGIAEHNLMGMAAGLAAAGWTPYVNTMAAFASSRAAEAVKIDISYNALPVRIAATHGGVSAGHMGPTHQSLEDLAMMRLLPDMTVLVPPDARAVRSLMGQLASVPGPAYLRLGRKPTPALPEWVPDPVLGHIQPLRDGHDVVVVSTGSLPVLAALEAAEMLEADGISTAVLHAHTIKPFDVAGLLARTESARLVVTIEEHWRAGGLGSLVAESLAENLPRRLLRIGMPDSFVHQVGTQHELLAAAGIGPAQIAARTRTALA